ncbi:MAG: acetoin utilization protein AcuC [Chloroflexi bacterium]|nr:acetoin utilization protein AcuC [Chloroflexota bacterium]
MTAEPIVVWSEAITEYDFGPSHPLTPRRFGPGIELMRGVGATRFLEPPIATDEELRRLHQARYIRQVRSFSDDAWQPAAMGIGTADCPSFHGMHEASARVAGGSITSVRQVLAGAADHVFDPGGGLHHAMADRASGFCIYNDVALAVAEARDAGHRVLYVDLDVHHGDGTQALFWDDPQVLTLSIHETGRSLFPGTGDLDEAGGPDARGSAVNVPLEAYTGDTGWLAALDTVLPALAETFQPTFLVTQHGCDSHAFDPLAHLRITTRAYARATRLLDQVAHTWCEGRWVATGGGGYDAYRVVPRSWALVWLAQAHREIPDETPLAWRERWTDEATRFGQSPLPVQLLDPPDLAARERPEVVDRARRTAERALEQTTRLLEG